MRYGIRHKRLILFVALFLIISTIACSLASPLFGNNTQSEPSKPTSESPTIQQSNPNPTATPELETIFTLENGEEQVPPSKPLTFIELLEQNIEDGTWERGQGIVLLLSYLADEREPATINGYVQVMEPNPTGVVRYAYEYLESDNINASYAQEIERLLAELSPRQVDLDRLSQSLSSSYGFRYQPINFQHQIDIPSECAALAGAGFSANIDTGEYCYVYEEADHAGGTSRVYYPKWWQSEEAKLELVESTLEALNDSAKVFTKHGEFKDVNAVFSISQPRDMKNTLAYVPQFPSSEACPITILPLSSAGSVAVFQQTIAHEAFHCFQDWNLDSYNYSVAKWWVEGSAEYFSNVVYPTTNDEQRMTSAYYARSIHRSWFDMSYENFILFQYFGNKLGDPSLISLLSTLSSAGSVRNQSRTLAAYPNMGSMFQEFVVATFSDGVLDSGGGRISQSPIQLRRIEDIDEAIEEEFTIDPFVAGRFGLRYVQELRFLEEPIEEDNVKHSAALKDERKIRSAWSELPPEVRSFCDDDLYYALAITSVDGPATFTADINTVEEAKCDPCLLGTWDMEVDSFEEYLEFMLRTYGGSQMPAGSSVRIDIQPHQYVDFNEKGLLRTRKVGFVIELATGPTNPVTITTDAQGIGGYWTDKQGEVLHISDLIQHTNSSQVEAEGFNMLANMGPDEGMYSFFGNTIGGPGLLEAENESRPTTAFYTCDLRSLEVDMLEGPPVQFRRVDMIMPTAVPTPSLD